MGGAQDFFLNASQHLTLLTSFLKHARSALVLLKPQRPRGPGNTSRCPLATGSNRPLQRSKTPLGSTIWDCTEGWGSGATQVITRQYLVVFYCSDTSADNTSVSQYAYLAGDHPMLGFSCAELEGCRVFSEILNHCG